MEKKTTKKEKLIVKKEIMEKYRIAEATLCRWLVKKTYIRKKVSQGIKFIRKLPLEGEPFSFDTVGPQVASDEQLSSWYEMFDIDKSISRTIPIFNKMKELGHVKIVEKDVNQKNWFVQHLILTVMNLIQTPNLDYAKKMVMFHMGIFLSGHCLLCTQEE